jgi:AcrR family transcriptional regulator
MTKPDKRDEIIRAALELIAEQGFHGAPMAMIAVHDGVGAGTIYRYF